MKYTFLVLLFLSSSLAYSENNEVIGIFQQKQLGSVIAVFIINTSTQDFVYVKGHGDSKLDYKFAIPPELFLKHKKTINSETLKQFAFEPSDSDNLASPGFYTIKYILGEESVSYKVPEETDSETINNFKHHINSYIQKANKALNTNGQPQAAAH
jgi:hypothetical protein